MIDRISGFWPNGGAAGLGRLRAEKDIDPRQWFFKAHFFTDPVQPGSLGLEAVLQTLQAYMIETWCHEGLTSPRFESIAVEEPVSWTYRGQVLPENRRVTILLEVNEKGRDQRGVFAKASASVWVDGTKIYSFPKLGMRVIDGAGADDVEILDPARDTWLRDHCPTYTVPVLPMMSIVDRLAAAAQRAAPDRRILMLENITLNGWISFASGPRRLKTSVSPGGEDRLTVILSVWRDAPHATMSRFDVMAQADVQLGENYPSPPVALPALENPELVHDSESLSVYEAGELFHDRGFHFLRKLWRTGNGASFRLDSEAGAVPYGFLNQGLFDGATHGIPNENLRMWSDRIAADQVGYPSRVPRLSLFDKPPADGKTDCEVRFAGFHSDGERFPQFRIQLRTKGQIWAEMELVYTLFPKGPLGRASGAERRVFLRGHTHVRGLALSEHEDGVTTLRSADLQESDWLPGTLESAFALGRTNRLRDLAIKEHVARMADVHPASVTVSDNGESAKCRNLPLLTFGLVCSQHGEIVRVWNNGEPRLELTPVRNYWRGLSGISKWPLEDLHLSLIERFVRRIELKDPAGFAILRGKPAMFLANHQVAVESILFNVVISALTETPNKVVAKIEHRESWIGRLIQFARSYPGQRQPEPILFFDRSDPRALPVVLNEFRRNLEGTPSSLLVHVEGTRARRCRAPVTQVSSVFVDLALEWNMPIVPVRFVGGLPVNELEERIEFPVEGGQQDIVIGAPIACDTLRGMTLVSRSNRILDAINSLGFPNEVPLPPNGSTMVGFAQTRKVLVETLRQAGNRCAETDALLSTLDGADPDWPREEHRTWMDELLAWLKT
jgi:3-hydroxymyristoyl/3-hydroxydecanoyl-(acyl carrier protein) dehydratase/1-acyl-sn-glycerol-3-phosphate acyltransferase